MLGPGVGPRAREPLGCRAGSASKQDSVGLVELLRREIAELVADDRSVELPVRSLAIPAHDRHHEREDLSRRKLLLVIGFRPVWMPSQRRRRRRPVPGTARTWSERAEA